MAGVTKAIGMLQRVNKPLLLLFMVLLVSCSGTVLHEFRSMDNRVWHSNDTLDFVYGHDRPDSYVACVEARVAASYPYKNLVVRVECLSTKSSIPVVVDTVCCGLYTDNGRHKGATAGILYQVSSVPMYVDAEGCDTLQFRLSHMMDTVDLCGVSDVGIRLSSSRGLRQSSGR